MNIFSVHASRTDFLNHQIESLRYFCKEQFNYFCIDNFSEPEKSNYIKNKCDELKVNYVKFDDYPIIGSSSNNHASALNSIKKIANDNEVNIILDFDIFLISQFSFLECISEYNIAGVYQQRNNFSVEYLAPFVVIVNKDSNFCSLDFSTIPGCDVGGGLFKYLKNNKVKLLNHTSSLQFTGDEKCFTIPYDIKYGCQIIESSFLHYYRGTNWNNLNQNIVKLKTEWLEYCLSQSKNNKIVDDKYLSKYQTLSSHSFCFWNGTDEKLNSILNPYLN